MVSYIKEGTKAKGILNMIQRKTFRSKRGNIVKWRRLHIEELYNVYRSLNIVRMIKTRRLRWADNGSEIWVPTQNELNEVQAAEVKS